MKISWGWVHYFLRNSVHVRVRWKKILECSGHVRVRWKKTPDMFRSCSGQVKTKSEMFGLCSGQVSISPEVECLSHNQNQNQGHIHMYSIHMIGELALLIYLPFFSKKKPPKVRKCMLFATKKILNIYALTSNCPWESLFPCTLLISWPPLRGGHLKEVIESYYYI